MMIFLSSDEEDLVCKAKDGDRGAFDQLYQKYKRPILNYIYRFVGNRASAEELAQETFIRAYLNIHRFQPRAKFSSWLYRIAANLSKNFLRHASYERKLIPNQRRSTEGFDEDRRLIEEFEDSTKKPDEIALSRETSAIVQEAINELPTHLKEALMLCDIEGFSYDEAAKVMGCKSMTVGSRLWRAREKLSKILKHLKNGD
ncbi:sigma-70 family RNA polymerase sigma factor [Candidatus Omnitrophota bacterium]